MKIPYSTLRVVYLLLFCQLLNGLNAVGQCWKQIAVGGTYVMALKDDGTIWGWGTNNNGQLGLGYETFNPINTAIQMGTDNDWDTLITSNNSTLARKTDGSLWGWGQNGDGELGLGVFGRRSSPTLVSSTPGWRSITTSLGAFAIAIRTDGTLWGWGANDRCKLGIGTTGDQTSPVQISASTDWKKIAGGTNHVIALKTDGTLWGWGDNTGNQISNTAPPDMQCTPVQIGTATDWADVAAGEGFSLAVKTDGTLWSWGRNHFGQLGVGNTNTITTQVQVGTATDWMSVFAGSDHIVAAKTDSSLWGWGLNTSGELGYASPTQQNSPAALGIGAVDWVSVDLGFKTTLVHKGDNSIWATGRNVWSLLGNNTAGGNITTFRKAGPLTYDPYVPALGGGSAILSASCDSSATGYYSYGTALHLNRKLFSIYPKGNTGTFTVTYDTSRNTNTTPLLQTDATHATSLMGRLVTVTYSGTIGNGVTVRFYYSAADSTNASNALDAWIAAHPGTVKQWAWVKYEGDAAALVSNQTPDGFDGTFSIYRPNMTGFESGVRFREFRELTSFSTFAGFAYANLTNTPFDFVLPVTMKYFNAYPQGTATMVKWTTASESGNTGFAIERRDNSLTWQTIGYVPSQAFGGNSTAELQYNFTDKNPANGTNYYRLRQEDKDGRATYSRIVSVTFKNDNVISVYPNPAREVFHVSGMQGGETVSVYNALGHLQRREQIPGRGTYQLSLAGLPKGVYLVKVQERTAASRSFKLIVE